MRRSQSSRCSSVRRTPSAIPFTSPPEPGFGPRDASIPYNAWLRSTLPSNSLASIYGLIEHCAHDRVLSAHTGEGETDHFVEVFADKIPHTHGAPVRAALAG